MSVTQRDNFNRKESLNQEEFDDKENSENKISVINLSPSQKRAIKMSQIEKYYTSKGLKSNSIGTFLKLTQSQQNIPAPDMPISERNLNHKWNDLKEFLTVREEVGGYGITNIKAVQEAKRLRLKICLGDEPEPGKRMGDAGPAGFSKNPKMKSPRNTNSPEKIKTIILNIAKQQQMLAKSKLRRQSTKAIKTGKSVVANVTSKKKSEEIAKEDAEQQEVRNRVENKEDAEQYDMHNLFDQLDRNRDSMDAEEQIRQRTEKYKNMVRRELSLDTLWCFDFKEGEIDLESKVRDIEQKLSSLDQNLCSERQRRSIESKRANLGEQSELSRQHVQMMMKNKLGSRSEADLLGTQKKTQNPVQMEDTGNIQHVEQLNTISGFPTPTVNEAGMDKSEQQVQNSLSTMDGNIKSHFQSKQKTTVEEEKVKSREKVKEKRTVTIRCEEPVRRDEVQPFRKAVQKVVAEKNPYLSEYMVTMREKGLIDPDIQGSGLSMRGNMLGNNYYIWPKIKPSIKNDYSNFKWALAHSNWSVDKIEVKVTIGPEKGKKKFISRLAQDTFKDKFGYELV